MNNSELEISDYEFTLTLYMKGDIVDRRHDLTIGGLTMIYGKRTLVLDFNQSYSKYIDWRNVTEIKCTFPNEHFEVLEDGTRYNESFPDCKFDLKVDDMYDSYNVLWVDGYIDTEIDSMHLCREHGGGIGSSRVIEWSEYCEKYENKEDEDSTDYIEYKGKKYKTRELTMIEEGWGEVTRTIAGEDLYDAITKDGTDDTYMDDDTSEEYGIDSQIYHYVETHALDLSGEEICKSYLDMEFEFVKED